MLRAKSNQISLLEFLNKLGVNNTRINNIIYYKQLSDAQIKQAQELVHVLNEDIHLKSYIDQIRDKKIDVDAKQFYNEMRVKINSSKLKGQLEGEGDKKFEQMTNLIYYLSEELEGHINVKKLMRAIQLGPLEPPLKQRGVLDANQANEEATDAVEDEYANELFRHMQNKNISFEEFFVVQQEDLKGKMITV